VRKHLALAVPVLALLMVGPLSAAPIDTNGQTETTDQSPDNCGNGNRLEATYPTRLWPPNHKYYGDQPNETLQFVATDDDGGEVTLETRGTHNQYDGDTEFSGAGNTGDDVVPNDDGGTLDSSSTDQVPVYVETDEGSVTTMWMARSERAGNSLHTDAPNRVYTLTGDAMFDDGTCSLTIEITVPHDMGKGDGNGKKEPVR
jgi:hypothetical protein